MRRLIRVGMKAPYNRLTSDYKKILNEVREAVTDGWV